jgi:DNA-binding PadR family transcriptional regulator
MLRRRGTTEFHGYEIAKRLGAEADHRLLTAYGTLYRALGRLEAMGLLHSRWEDPEIPARENRPGRRLYALTAAGETAAQDARQAARETKPKRAARRPVPA